MIFLTTTSESLTLVTDVGLSVDWAVGYVDIDSVTGATPGSQQGNVATATTTTVVSAPGSGVQRQLKFFTAVNKDTVYTQTVTLNKVTGVGVYSLVREVPLAPNETLVWVDSIGFEILDDRGVRKVANTLVSLSTGVTGTLPATNGGTGQSSYTIGDLLYASSTTALSRLADVATGNALISGGVAAAPMWGKIDLTAHVSGVLPVANGGTGLSSGTSGGVLGYTASGTLASSGVLTANAIVLGGGPGATPSALGSLGTTTTVLHGNVAGAPTFGAVSLTADVSGILPGANGGTDNGFFAVSGPTTSLKTFTFPNASATVLTTNAAVTVAQGGTGITSGTDGGILGFTATGTLASSGVLTANRIVLGGGAGATPAVLGSLGTTTTVLHGNAAGAPTFGAVSLTADVSGTLPVANGGTGITSFGTGVATWLGTPSSANLAAALTDETGTGALVFANTPTLVTPAIGAATGTSVNLTSTATATSFIPTGSTVPTNGVYLPAANTVGVAANSANVMNVTSTGVGIGAGVSPAFKLDIQGAAPTAGDIRLAITDTVSSSACAFLKTGATYSYAGVGANGTWVYSQNSILYLGSDGNFATKVISNGAVRLTVDPTGGTFVGSVSTSSPGSGAGAWKLGVAVAGVGLALNTTSYVEIDIGGTVHKLAKVL